MDIDQEIREAERQYMDFLDDGVKTLFYCCSFKTFLSVLVVYD